MRILGYILIWGGFLLGAYSAVRQAEGLLLAGYWTAVPVGVIGVVLVRVSMAKAARQEDTLSANVEAIAGSLERLVSIVGTMNENRETIDVYDLRHRIDDEIPVEVNRFVEARQSIAHSFGLPAYAAVMNPFSAGERYLNRVWSCSTDGYIDEAHRYLGMAAEQFREAQSAFRELRPSV